MNYTDFKTPTRLDEARALLKELGDAAVPVAGSTLHVFLRDETPRIAVDITRLGLDGIRREEGNFEIGATTRVAELLEFRDDGWVLDRVADAFVSQTVRNAATVGGSIVRTFPWSDFPVALLVLNASMIITGDSDRVVDADTYFASQPFHHFQPGDLLTAIRVPPLVAGEGFGYHKERRTGSDFSRLTLAARLDVREGRVGGLRIAAGSGVPLPTRLTAVEKALVGARPGPKKFAEAAEAGLEEVRWRGSAGLSDDYIRHLASVRIVDVLTQAYEEAKGERS